MKRKWMLLVGLMLLLLVEPVQAASVSIRLSWRVPASSVEERTFAIFSIGKSGENQRTPWFLRSSSFFMKSHENDERAIETAIEKLDALTKAEAQERYPNYQQCKTKKGRTDWITLHPGWYFITSYDAPLLAEGHRYRTNPLLVECKAGSYDLAVKPLEVETEKTDTSEEPNPTPKDAPKPSEESQPRPTQEPDFPDEPHPTNQGGRNHREKNPQSPLTGDEARILFGDLASLLLAFLLFHVLRRMLLRKGRQE